MQILLSLTMASLCCSSIAEAAQIGLQKFLEFRVAGSQHRQSHGALPHQQAGEMQQGVASSWSCSRLQSGPDSSSSLHFFFFMAFSATLEEFLNPKLPLHAFYLILEKTYCSHLCFPDLVLQSTFKNILILEIQRQAEEFLKNMPKSQCMFSCVVYSKRDIQLHLW